MDLINTGTDPWILEHNACEILNRDILEQLNKRSSLDISATEYDALSARIRNRLKQFSSQVDQLDKKLKTASVISSITEEEVERRRRQIDILQSNGIKLWDEFNRRKGTNNMRFGNDRERARLFGPKKESPMFADMGSTSWGDVASNKSTPAYDFQAVASKSIEELKEDQQLLLREQDEGLESLSKIISRQKDIASTINIEVNEQNELLDDLNEVMGRTDGRIKRETNLVTVIQRKDSTWGYWAVILLLLVLIIGVSLA